MGGGLQRAFAATAITRLTDRQRSVLAALSDEWMNVDQIVEATGIGGRSPHGTAAHIANRMAHDFVIDKGGTRAAPLWRLNRRQQT